MGGFLDKPITTKKVESGQNEKLRFTTCEMQGWRRFMEDTKLTHLSLEGYEHLSLFGVFDGHGGDEVAKYVEKHFVQEFLKRGSLKEKDIGKALKETFIQMDLLLKTNAAIEEQLKYKQEANDDPKIKKEQLQAGCTAIVVVISPEKIYVANAGDSRAVLMRNGKVEALSEDHKPSLESERDRIIKAGATIVEGRVNGNLNLTRSLGDFSQKNVPKVPFHLQPIICLPEVRELERTGKEEFIIMGCDGIWERYEDNSEPFAIMLKTQLATTDAKTVLENFFDDNLSKGGMNPQGRDNMTAVLVEFIN